MPSNKSEASHPIQFFTERGGQALTDRAIQKLRPWLSAIAADYGTQLTAINYIFCGDEYLHNLNLQYLNHDTLTDIITFPLSPPPSITADLFISTERVADNALQLGQTYHQELCRVMIHGVLHLCGLSDKATEAAAAMRQAEDKALARLAVDELD
ncbi:MAG: rRNA maturation RNase YbeY [Lewinella sp.]|nr:rRNA maturation RNase YbeY [Lewinella sp.]